MSDAKFHLVARASILASGATDDFHHVAPDAPGELVLVSVESFDRVTRERDEETRKRYAAERERDEALKAKDEQLDDSERIIAALKHERDEARAQAEERAAFAAAETEHANKWCERARKAEAEAAALREALREVLTFDARYDKPECLDRAREALKGGGP